MPADIPSLWSDLIKPGILSPFAILRAQAEALKEQTNSILVPEINSEEHGSRIKHTLLIVVPPLDGFRYSALEIAHHKISPYPVYSLGPGFRHLEDEFNNYVLNGVRVSGLVGAHNQDEFIEVLSKMLTHPSLVGTLQGLIARVGDL